MRPNTAFSLGLAATIASAILWHGPGGAADRFVTRSERDVREMLEYFEMTHVEGRVQRGPIARRILYSGQADLFQRSELVRLGEDLPGIGEARWSRPKTTLSYPLPLVVEAVALAIGAFLIGLTISTIAWYARREPT